MPIHIIRVANTKTILKNEKIQTCRVYYLEGIKITDVSNLEKKLFRENLTQISTVDKPLIKNSVDFVEVAYKPGVMNPEVASIIKAAKDLGVKLAAVDSSTEYHFFKPYKKGDGKKYVEKNRLYNPTIEHIVSQKPKTLLIKGKIGKTSIIPLRNMSDEKLLELSKDKLYLDLQEMKVIQNYFQSIKRDPTDVELETLAQTWSEHCAHKTFKAKLVIDGVKKDPLMGRLKKEALKHDNNIVSAFVDNSGVMDFYDEWAICGKVETHNSPSAIEPYGGAATGSGGVFRDVIGTGQGAKVIASSDIFCFAHLNLPEKLLPEGCLPPQYLLERIVKGVKDYGNRMGIPTNNGSVHFHNDFRAKPTVIVGGFGLLPKKRAQKGRAKVGDSVIVLGGRTGRDGIHGATFSSAEMTDKTISINSSAVQIGNAIEEKRMFDAILEASDAGLIRVIQDCGAGGFSSAIGEMGEDIGVSVDISKAPLKYIGLSPWEIWVSESQERMATAIAPKNVSKFLAVCKKYNVEAVALGTFDGSNRIKVFYGKEKVCDLDCEFLFNGLPQREMAGKKPNILPISQTKKVNNVNVLKVFKKILENGNIASKEPIVRSYDHTVQGTNVIQPYIGEKLDGPTDAVVIRPLLSRPYGMVLSHGLNPVLNNYDPYWGSIWAGVEALSNYVAVGGDNKNATLINNYIWPFPDEDSLWSLDRSVDAVVDMMKTFQIPVISGKDSLSSTYRGKSGKVIKIPPVLCMSVFGKIPDVSKTVSSDFKKSGSTIYLLGTQDLQGMGGSIFAETASLVSRNIPKADLKNLPKLFDSLHSAITSGKVLSCHDVSEGGVMTAIFEMCIGGNTGAEIKTPSKSSIESLFNETPGVFIVELDKKTDAKKLFGKIPFTVLGKTTDAKKLVVKNMFEENLDSLSQVWKKPMKDIFK